MGELRLCSVDSAAARACSRVPKNVRLAFISSALIGLAVHFFALTNLLVNRDGIPGLFASHDRTVIGRYLLVTLRDLFTNYSMPWVNGLVTILSYALIAAIVVAILRIEKPVYVILTGAAILTFPTVGNFLSYMHTADANAIGLLIGVIGAYCLDRWKWGFLPAALLFSLSLGTYQANVCFLGALMATRGLQIVLAGDKSDGEVLLTIVKYAAAFGLGALLYSKTNALMLNVKGQELDSYMGVSDAGAGSAAQLWKLFIKGYRRYFRFLTRDSLDMTTRITPIAHMGLIALSCALFAARLFQNKKRTVLQWALAVIVFALLPIAYDSIYLFGPELVHILMLHSAAFTYILPLMLLDGLTERGGAKAVFLARAASWAGTLAVLACVYFWTIYTNQGYLLLRLKYENMSTLCTRVVDSIERMEGYEPGMRVAFIGCPSEGNYPPSKGEYLDAFYTGMGFGNKNDFGFLNDDKHVQNFIRYHIGVGFSEVDAGTLWTLENAEETKRMPCYPEQGSMQDMGGVLVIKLGAE